MDEIRKGEIMTDTNKQNIIFAKIRPGAKIPSKRDEDMGFDIYACFDGDCFEIPPHKTKLIPTGIASACDPDHGFVLRERGSTGSKGIALRAGVIDSGYRNEWFVGLTNTTDSMLVISKLNEEETLQKYYNNKTERVHTLVYPYSKAIAQALFIPVPKVEIKELSYYELKNIKSERGMGKLGSSLK